jgi:hypothetical protein
MVAHRIREKVSLANLNARLDGRRRGRIGSIRSRPIGGANMASIEMQVFGARRELAERVAKPARVVPTGLLAGAR